MASSSSYTMSLLTFFFFFFSLALISIARASVPPSETFMYVNEGEFGPYINDFASTTPPQMLTLFLFVWVSKGLSLCIVGFGKPTAANLYVKMPLSLSLGTNGNLALAEADGTVAWQTNTANKGVVSSKLLSNGNFVLYDSKENVDGTYSFVLESKQLSMYRKINNSSRPVLYYSVTLTNEKDPVQYVKFNSDPETDEGFAYDLTLEISSGGSFNFARPKYNITSSFLRLGMDGNLVIYTYYDKVFWGGYEKTFSLFDRDSNWETECQLPERCGKLGVCEDNQCVACPSEKGQLGWSKSCEPKKLNSCDAKDFYYYKVEGVDHYMSKYTRGSEHVRGEDCGKKCTSDCKCLGYFYKQDTSRCWLAYDLMTLTKVSNSTHLGFIKVPRQQVITANGHPSI
ncbi:hypothetical protein Dsin_022079 [Dipteronia sinensis]|uniref:Bulb-type lectin domain-containing protein n=1 Tax=Dipteronia sinensis TaxID=43782 RepID=A0AAE0A0Y2_9ROSI|nr:hypothetical protein Dsin_022079 [Dipteronia sinensis]